MLSWAWQHQLLSVLVLGQEKGALNQEHCPAAPWRLGAHDWRRGGLPYCPIFFCQPIKNMFGSKILYSLIPPQCENKDSSCHSIKEKRLYL